MRGCLYTAAARQIVHGQHRVNRSSDDNHSISFATRKDPNRFVSSSVDLTSSDVEIVSQIVSVANDIDDIFFDGLMMCM